MGATRYRGVRKKNVRLEDIGPLAGAIRVILDVCDCLFLMFSSMCREELYK
ncbi:hypothetical protein BgiMline_032526, partial [Biomphalaria glabrata]